MCGSSWRGAIGPVAVRWGAVRLCVLWQQTTLVIGTAASSTVRSGMDRGRFWQGLVVYGLVGQGLLRCVMETALVVGTVASSRTRSGMDCGQARHVMAWQVVLCSGMFRRGNHHRAGTEADQRGRGGIFLAMRGQSGCGGSMSGAYRRVLNHARAGTGLDQRQRRGMYQVMVRRVDVGYGAAWRVFVEVNCGR